MWGHVGRRYLLRSRGCDRQRWEYTATKGENTESGTVQVRRYKMFKKEKEVGSVDPQGGTGLGDRTVLTFTDFGQFNGTAILEKTHLKPPIWKGTLRSNDGSQWQFTAKLLEK